MWYFWWGCRGNLTLITLRSERVNVLFFPHNGVGRQVRGGGGGGGGGEGAWRLHSVTRPERGLRGCEKAHASSRRLRDALALPVTVLALFAGAGWGASRGVALALPAVGFGRRFRGALVVQELRVELVLRHELVHVGRAHARTASWDNWEEWEQQSSKRKKKRKTPWRWLWTGLTCWYVVAHRFNPNPKSDQVQFSPEALPEILHHTVWRTWLP